MISYTTTSGFTSNKLSRAGDYIIWYCKNSAHTKYRQIYTQKENPLDDTKTKYDQIELSDGTRRALTKEEKLKISPLPDRSKIFRYGGIDSQGSSGEQPFDFEGKIYFPSKGRHWTANFPAGMEQLRLKKRIGLLGSNLSYIRYFDDFPLRPIHNLWFDIGGSVQSRSDPKVYVVQTGTAAIQRCLLMSTDPSDLVLDITCGSGTTAYVAEQWGRRWITCDTSRIALALAKQRLMTANFDYYQLARPREGISSGFVYKTVPHITLKSIANNEPPATETLYDQPLKATNLTRVTGPFTVEAVPAPYAKSLDAFDHEAGGADASIARSGETHRQGEWRDELLKTGVRAKDGNIIRFSRVETLPGAKHLQAQAETQEDNPKKVLLVFGPEHAPLAKRRVESAIDEARFLKPDILLFCAFVFEEEAAKDIDETPEALLGFKLLKAQMNADLLTDDLRKKRASNESFWLIGQPDVQVTQLPDGKLQVEVLGFDYYNPKTGNVESGGKKNIAMWMLDTDYDGRSLFPKQVFFPMAGNGEGWDRLARNLKAEIDEEKIEAFGGTVSLPFAKADKIAVKIIDDRGIESLRVISL